MQAEKFDAAIDMICFTPEETQNSLRAFRDIGHFVMCSTVCTYGIDYDWFPTTEDHPLRPITDYGRGKTASAAVFMAAYYKSGFPVTIIKPSLPMALNIGWRSRWPGISPGSTASAKANQSWFVEMEMPYTNICTLTMLTRILWGCWVMNAPWAKPIIWSIAAISRRRITTVPL